MLAMASPRVRHDAHETFTELEINKFALKKMIMNQELLCNWRVGQRQQMKVDLIMTRTLVNVIYSARECTGIRRRRILRIYVHAHMHMHVGHGSNSDKDDHKLKCNL